MADAWVIDEMKTADLKDKRLNDRLREVLSQLAARPTASIPAACGGRAEMVGAYRLFDNEKATFEEIVGAHADATRKRVTAQPVVVLAQDTTEIDLTRPKAQVEGAGPLDGNSRRGALLHPLHAFTPDGTPLGTLYAKAWVRGEETVCASLSRSERASTPIEDKESHRWIETLSQAQTEAARCPSTRVICVADSEADIYEFVVQAMKEPRPCEWIVRACQDRALAVENSGEQGEKRLRGSLLSNPLCSRKRLRCVAASQKLVVKRAAADSLGNRVRRRWRCELAGSPCVLPGVPIVSCPRLPSMRCWFAR